MAARRPRSKGKAANTQKGRGPFPTYRPWDPLMGRTPTGDPFERRVRAFQWILNQGQYVSELEGFASGVDEADQRAATGSRTGGQLSGQSRGKKALKLEVELIADAIDLVRERDGPCGPGCEHPCTRHKPPSCWARYTLASALFERYEDEGDSERFTSAAAIDKRLKKYWTRSDQRLRNLLLHLDRYLRAPATRSDVATRFIEGTLCP